MGPWLGHLEGMCFGIECSLKLHLSLLALVPG